VRFVQILQSSSKLAWWMCMDATVWFRAKPPPQEHSRSQSQQQGQGSQAWSDTWQQLLLAPHLLPCVAAVVVVVAYQLGRAVEVQVRDSRSSSSRSSSSGGSKEASSSQRQLEQGRLCTPCTIINSSGSSNSGDVSAMAGQLQLTQLVGVTPKVADWVLEADSHSSLFATLDMALATCFECCAASQQLLHSSSSTTRDPGSGVSEQQQQRWQYEQRLWQLLPGSSCHAH
jgi:hypothetical protein